MPLHNAVGVNRNKATTTGTKTQVPSIWAKWIMLDEWACIF